ncbi:hypothetical protein Avbf_07336, partial [Armadillidium vulgare]
FVREPVWPLFDSYATIIDFIILDLLKKIFFECYQLSIISNETAYHIFHFKFSYGLGCLSSESENENLCEHTQARSMMQRRCVSLVASQINSF